MVKFFDFEAPTIDIAISNYIAAHFGRWDENDNYLAPEVDTIRAWALEAVNELAAQRENELDSLIAGNFVRTVMLNTEIVAYFQAGRPANPQANIYVISNAMATRRGITLREMLEILFGRWRDIQAAIATIITELDRVTGEIEAAGSVAEIEAVLVSIAA